MPAVAQSSDLLSVHQPMLLWLSGCDRVPFVLQVAQNNGNCRPPLARFGFLGLDPNRQPFDQPFAALVSADSARDAARLFGKLQPPFDQPGDRVARQI
jgi:hypothetical protein